MFPKVPGKIKDHRFLHILNGFRPSDGIQSGMGWQKSRTLMYYLIMYYLKGTPLFFDPIPTNQSDSIEIGHGLVNITNR